MRNCPAAADSSYEGWQSAKAGSSPSRYGGVVRILVADDEEVIRELVRATLAGDPALEVYQARDGEQAVQLAHEHAPDLLILDVRMPKLDGFQVCAAVRRDARTRNATVLMLTALGQDTDRQRGLEAGANDYFIKPFSPTALLSKVYGLMDASEGV